MIADNITYETEANIHVAVNSRQDKWMIGLKILIMTLFITE